MLFALCLSLGFQYWTCPLHTIIQLHKTDSVPQGNREADKTLILFLRISISGAEASVRMSWWLHFVLLYVYFSNDTCVNSHSSLFANHFTASVWWKRVYWCGCLVTKLLVWEDKINECFCFDWENDGKTSQLIWFEVSFWSYGFFHLKSRFETFCLLSLILFIIHQRHILHISLSINILVMLSSH